LQQVAMMRDDRFEIINIDGLEEESLQYLRRSQDRCQVLLQWIQRLVVMNISNGVLPIAPPILSRVFQELSRGMVNLQNAKKIKEFPFPFPYAQMITFMLTIHWIITPVANCLMVENKAWAAVLTFVSIFVFWSINYIAIQIELPFGDDVNDLPMADMQRDMNRSLWVLLEKKAQTPPCFAYNQTAHTTRGSIKAMTMGKGLTRVLSNCWPLPDTGADIPAAAPLIGVSSVHSSRLSTISGVSAARASGRFHMEELAASLEVLVQEPSFVLSDDLTAAVQPPACAAPSGLPALKLARSNTSSAVGAGRSPRMSPRVLPGAGPVALGATGGARPAQVSFDLESSESDSGMLSANLELVARTPDRLGATQGRRTQSNSGAAPTRRDTANAEPGHPDNV